MNILYIVINDNKNKSKLVIKSILLSLLLVVLS